MVGFNGPDRMPPAARAEAEIIAPKGVPIGGLETALRAAGITYEVSRRLAGDEPTVAFEGVLYIGEGAAEELLGYRDVDTSQTL